MVQWFIIGKAISEFKVGEVWFSTIDLKYASSQYNLDSKISKHCNFTKIGGDCNCTYSFKTCSNRLTDAQAELQKAMDFTLSSLRNTYCVLNDNIIVRRGSKTEHINDVYACFKVCNDDKFRINLPNCQYAKQEKICFCQRHNFCLVEDHMAIGFVETKIQTTKRRQDCNKRQNIINKSNTNFPKAIIEIICQLRFRTQKSIKPSPFNAHYGRPSNTPIKNISSFPILDTLKENIVKKCAGR